MQGRFCLHDCQKMWTWQPFLVDLRSWLGLWVEPAHPQREIMTFSFRRLYGALGCVGGSASHEKTNSVFQQRDLSNVGMHAQKASMGESGTRQDHGFRP